MKTPLYERRRLGLGIYALVGGLIGLALLYWLWWRLGHSISLIQLKQIAPLMLWLTPGYVLPIAAAALSWRLLFPQQKAPGLFAAIQLTWIGLGINWLLPVAMVGGELVKFRLATARGWKQHTVIASLVGDKTLQVGSQVAFTLLGVALLVLMSGWLSGLGAVLAMAVLFSAVIYAFCRLQHSGLFSGLAARLSRFSSNQAKVRLHGAKIDVAIRSMYRRQYRWWLAAAWRMAFRLLMVGEIWLVMAWHHWDVLWWQMIVMESMAQGARAAAFFIPAGIGAQESGLIAVGLLLGIPAEQLLLLAVVKRARELTVGGIGLLGWQWAEGNRWWRRQTNRPDSG
ncbi:MAG: lysylphosphatidylglycerol synthase domain-containing protein [Wenzhouxiangellaceae bacterium]